KCEDLQIIYNFDEDNFELINYLEIIANGKVNVTILYKSNTNKPCFHNGIIKLKANENANVTISVINLLNDKSTNLESFESFLERDSKVNYTIVDLGGNISISNYYSNLIGENSKNNLKAIYLGIENQIKDINYISELRGEKTFVNIDVQGALKDKSKKNFKGTIEFKKGCKKAKGNENEYCMMLSKDAKSIALPMLLCSEDDVEGEHSSASGRVDKKALFYIMSRGLSYKEAIKLIVKARFNKILEKIQNEELRKEITEIIDNKLD
ncbi:MAG: SufD family Fe-S cluster assembly protein, partial [Clostridia bacterium]|nr:SufD family Fe-S cluster assembly protein [Clostridia bacterium]